MGMKIWTWLVLAWIGISSHQAAARAPGPVAEAAPSMAAATWGMHRHAAPPLQATRTELAGAPRLSAAVNATARDTELEEPSGAALMLSGLVLVALIVKRRRDNAHGVGPDCVRPPPHG